jgi:hypothetical protein
MLCFTQERILEQNAEGRFVNMAKKSTPTQKVYAALAAVEPEIKSIILAGVYQMRKAAEELSIVGLNEAQKLILHKGSYKEYTKNGVKRMSSSPGEPPAATRGGDLESSLYQKVVSRPNQNPAVAEFGSKAPFAKDLEFGTTKLQPRPFMRPARNNVAKVAGSHVVRNLQIAYTRKTKALKGKTFVVDMEA